MRVCIFPIGKGSQSAPSKINSGAKCSAPDLQKDLDADVLASIKALIARSMDADAVARVLTAENDTATFRHVAL